MDDYLRKLIDAPLADPARIYLPQGKRAAPRSAKVEYDDIGCSKLTGEQVRDRKAKAAADKIEKLLDYYAGADLSEEKIAEHLGLYLKVQDGVDDDGKPKFVSVLDVGRVKRALAYRRRAA